MCRTITKDLAFMSSEFQKEGREKMRQKKVLEEIMAENSPNLAKYISLQIQEAKLISNMMNPEIHASVKQ